MSSPEFTYANVTLANQTCRAVIGSDGKVTIVTGPVVLDAIASIVTQYHEQLAEYHRNDVQLTLAQVLMGVAFDVQAHEFISVVSTHVYGSLTDFASAQEIAAEVDDMISVGKITGAMHSVYTARIPVPDAPYGSGS